MKQGAEPFRRRGRTLRAVTAYARRTPLADGERPAAASAGDADPAVVALTDESYADVDDARDRLRELRAHFDATDDRRGTFLSIYARMTGAVADRIDRGAFRDVDWVSAYLVAFADHYREAVHQYETGCFGDVPEPWVLAFDVAATGESLVVQDAALGVNAHINHDLALALDDAGITTETRTRRADHDAVIDVIRALVDDTQDALAARDAAGVAVIDDLLGRVDEWLTVTSIDECRTSAWRTAVAMNSRFRARRRFAHWWNAATATGVAYLVHSTHASERVHGTLRDLERGSRDSRRDDTDHARNDSRRDDTDHARNDSRRDDTDHARNDSRRDGD
jgi:hypothetical protein